MSSSTHTADTETVNDRHAAVRDHTLAALADTHADGESVKATVLRELHRQHPAIALEDVLELNVSISIPTADTVSECVDSVFTEAIEQHDAWQTEDLRSDSARPNTPATEEC